MSMEIPAGRWCNGDRLCSLLSLSYDDRDLYMNGACPLFDDGPLERDGGNIDGDDQFKKMSACLSAYPNGATIEIKPKEVSE